MKTVELFAGIGGFRLAADEHDLETVWANDIDKNAVKVYKSNFGKDSIVEGDINYFLSDIPDHDILTGGFPCQPFSKAGKKLGIADYRGTLFEAIVSVIANKKPRYFVLENVNSLLYMNNGENYRTILFALAEQGYKIEWRVFNAVQFGLPQHRERVIITGTKSMATNQSYFLSSEDKDNLSSLQIDKIADYSQWVEIASSKRKFQDWGMAFGEKFIDASIIETSYVKPRTLKEVLQDPEQVNSSFDFTEDTLERIKHSQYVNKFYNGVQILYNQAGGARMGYSIFGIEGTAPTLTASTSRHYERYEINGKYRRLTPVEYARIQGFPDKHCSVLSPYDQYKYFGNAVPPQIISFVLSKIINNESEEVKSTEPNFNSFSCS